MIHPSLVMWRILEARHATNLERRVRDSAGTGFTWRDESWAPAVGRDGGREPGSRARTVKGRKLARRDCGSE